MRCPYCFARLVEKPSVCPNCHQVLVGGDRTLLAEGDNWYKEPYHVWIPLGNLVSIAGGCLLFYLGTQGLGSWGIMIGLFLLVLALLSLVVARGGFRWDDLSRGQQIAVWAGVLGFVGLVGLVILRIWADIDASDPYYRPGSYSWGYQRRRPASREEQKNDKPASSFFTSQADEPARESD